MSDDEDKDALIAWLREEVSKRQAIIDTMEPVLLRKMAHIIYYLTVVSTTSRSGNRDDILAGRFLSERIDRMGYVDGQVFSRLLHQYANGDYAAFDLDIPKIMRARYPWED